MIAICNGSRYYIYTLVNSPTDITLSPIFYAVYVVEYVLLCLGILYAIYFIYLVVKVRQFHPNLHHLAVFFIIASVCRSVGRIMIMSQEYTAYSRGNCVFVIHLGSFVILLSNCVTMHIFLCILSERTLAYIFIADYELKLRPLIGICIVILCVALSFPLAYIFYTMVVETIYATVYGGTISGISFIGYLYLWWANKKAYRQHGSLDQSGAYSLSIRFQLSENLRVFHLIRNTMIILFIDVSIVIGLRLAAACYGLGSETVYLQSLLSILFPIVMTTCILSCEKWRKHLVSCLNLQRITNKWTARVAHHQFSTQEVYFKQLDDAWVYVENNERSK